MRRISEDLCDRRLQRGAWGRTPQNSSALSSRLNGSSWFLVSLVSTRKSATAAASERCPFWPSSGTTVTPFVQGAQFGLFALAPSAGIGSILADREADTLRAIPGRNHPPGAA